MMIKRFGRHWPIVIPLILCVSVFHAWFQPGLILGADWVRRVPEELNNYFPWPHVWNSSQQIGENNGMYMSSFPIFALIGLASRMHFSWNVIERLFFLWPYVALSVVSPYVLAYRLTRSSLGAAVAASIWTVNTWTIMAAERGAIPSLVAASILPLFFFYALRFIEKATIRRGLGLGLLITAILVYDLRYVYIAIIFALILSIEQLLRDRSLRRLVEALPAIGFAIGTAIVTNLYWILPQFSEPSNAGAGYGSVADYILNSHYMSPTHSIADFGAFYHWVASNNPFSPHNPEWFFFCLPALVFVSLASTWKKRWVWSFASGAAIAVLLDSGPTFPLDGLNLWIFQHVPGMTLFRDVTKWMSLIGITYGIIIAYGIARLAAFARLRLRSRMPKYALAAIPIVAVLLYAMVMQDAYNVMRFRVFAPYNMHQDVLDLESYLQSRPGHARTLVFPRDIEPMRAIASHPYVEGLQLENSASPDGLRHLNLEWDSLYGLFSSPFAPDILRELNIAYVVVPYDYDKVVYSGSISNWTFSDAVQFMQSRPWLKFDRLIGRHYVFRVRRPMLAHGFIAPMPFVLNGSGSALAALVGTPLVSAKTAAILPDQPLGPIWRRIPNYIGGAWPVDTNLLSVKAAQQNISRGQRLTRDARNRRFSFVGAATSTASRRVTLYAGDDPILLDTSFDLPKSGRAHFTADLSNISLLNERLLKTAHFSRHMTTLDVNPDALLFEYNGGGALSIAPWSFNAARHGFETTLTVTSQNPVPVNVDLDLRSFRVTGSSNLGVSKGSKTWSCAQGCYLRAVRLEPGTNELSLFSAGAAADPAPSATFAAVVPLWNERVARIRQPLRVRTLLSGMHVRLDARPFIDFRYRFPRGTDPTNLILRLRSLRDGSQAFVVDSLQSRTEYTMQLQYLINNALLERFHRTLAAHAHDARWLYAHRLSDEPDGAGDYEITGLYVGSFAPKAHGLAIDARSLEMLATPSWPQMATLDARQPRSVRYPDGLQADAATGMSVRKIGGTRGYFGYALQPARPTSRTARFSAHIPPGSGKMLDFSFFQNAGYTITMELSNSAGLLWTEQLTPPNGDAFMTGTIKVIDQATAPWKIGEPHCVPNPCGAGADTPTSSGMWKHLSLDLSQLTDQWQDGFTMTFTLSQINGQDPQGGRFAIGTRDAVNALAQSVVPALMVDGQALHFSKQRVLSEIGYRVLSGTVPLGPRLPHRLSSFMTYPIRPVSATISDGTPRRFTSAEITNDHRWSDEEYTGDIESPGGLFVFDEAWDHDWKLALVGPNFHPTGDALIDFLRVRGLMLPESTHYRVTDLLNGWWLPKGRFHVFCLMQLQAINESAAIIWLVASVLWIGAVLRFGRSAES